MILNIIILVILSLFSVIMIIMSILQYFQNIKNNKNKKECLKNLRGKIIAWIYVLVVVIFSYLYALNIRESDKNIMELQQNELTK